MNRDRILFRRHAWQRMATRQITVADVLTVLAQGERIEEYPADTPFPSALLLATVAGRPLHIVAARDAETATTYIVTAYDPDPAEWDATFRVRRTR